MSPCLDSFCEEGQWRREESSAPQATTLTMLRVQSYSYVSVSDCMKRPAPDSLLSLQWQATNVKWNLWTQLPDFMKYDSFSRGKKHVWIKFKIKF